MTNPANPGNALRIRPWPIKLACVVAAGAVSYLFGLIPAGAGGAGILRSGIAFVLVLLGTRAFCGSREDPSSPRPWWRMTGGVRSGVALGVLFALVAIVSASGCLGLTLSISAKQDTSNLPALVLNTVLAAILTFLYFHSSRRLVVARRADSLAATKKRR